MKRYTKIYPSYLDVLETPRPSGYRKGEDKEFERLGAKIDISPEEFTRALEMRVLCYCVDMHGVTKAEARRAIARLHLGEVPYVAPEAVRELHCRGYHTDAMQLACDRYGLWGKITEAFRKTLSPERNAERKRYYRLMSTED